MERKFPVHSPRIENVEVKRSGVIRRAKLYFLRDRVGKLVLAAAEFARQQGFADNGYRVVNLGIKQPLAHILAAAEEHKAHAIGMSGLLVKSTVVMRENLERMSRDNLKVPVMLGGAALTRNYVETDCAAAYASGHVAYVQKVLSRRKIGAVIATISTWQGLAVGPAVTEVPQATRRSVVHSLRLLQSHALA